MKSDILINDFNLFYDVIRSISKVVDSAKLHIGQNGLEIYSARAKIARCEVTSNAIYTNSPIEFAIADLNLLLKLLSTIKDVHEGDYSDFKFTVDLPFIRFTSKKFKTKIHTDELSKIEKWVSEPIKAQLTPVCEFTTTPDFIKRINSHTFIFSNPETLRVYLDTKVDMEKNVIFATLGNNETQLNNELTLKFGLITFGSIPDNKQLVLDIERINLFNITNTKEIKISLMDKNVLVSKQHIVGKNDTYFNINLYNSLLKS
jgi:hypothetical protein